MGLATAWRLRTRVHQVEIAGPTVIAKRRDVQTMSGQSPREALELALGADPIPNPAAAFVAPEPVPLRQKGRVHGVRAVRHRRRLEHHLFDP